MKHEVSYQVQAERAVVVERIRAYMACVGYNLAQEGEELVFRRGSVWGSIAGFAPAQWLATVRARVWQTPNRAMKASFAYEINTIGQQVTGPEVDFWNLEVYGLERAVTAGVDVSAEARAAAQAAELEAELNNWRRVARLLVAPLVFFPFIAAFVVGIDPLVGLARALVERLGLLAVTGAVTAALLVVLSAGMFWLPRGCEPKRPLALLARTAAQSAYYGAFALLVSLGLCVLAAVERQLWVVLLIALSGAGTAFRVDKARQRKGRYPLA